LIPNAQIWPRALNTLIGGQANSVYLVVFDLGSDQIGTMDFIMGMVVLERLYSVFDTGNNRVGLATTQFTNATVN
jgi:cathepsin E